MRGCPKCGARAVRGVLCSGCGATRLRVRAEGLHTSTRDKRSLSPARPGGGLRPFIIAALVFFFLLVGARVAAGYYAAHAAKAALQQTSPDTVSSADSSPPAILPR